MAGHLSLRSPYLTPELTNGDHTLEVRAIDATGDADRPQGEVDAAC